MRAIWIIVLFVTAALAGCAESPEESEPTAEAEPTDTSDDVDAGAEAPQDNATEAPVFAAINATAVNGTAPLLVNFTLDGPIDALWSFDADGDGVAEFNGSALPADVNHTYMAGNHTALFEVTLGNETVNATMLIVVLEGAAEEIFGWDGRAFGTPEQYGLRQSGCGGRVLAMFQPTSMGCTYVDSSVYGALGGVTWNWAGNAGSNGFPPGTPVTMTWAMDCVGACVGDVSLSLRGDGVYAEGTESVTATHGVHTVTVQGTTQKQIEPGTTLVMRVNINTNGHFFLEGGELILG